MDGDVPERIGCLEGPFQKVYSFFLGSYKN